MGEKNNRPLEDVVQIACELKLDGIEIWDEHIHDYLRRHNCTITELKRYLDGNHLQCSGIAPYFDFLGNGGIEKNIEIAERAIEYAKQMNCNMIRTFVAWKPSKDLTKKEWKLCVDGLREITNRIKDEKIYFALETHNNQPIDTADNILYLLKEVNSNQLKVLFDGFNYIVDQLDLMDAYKKLEEYIIHYHMKNYRWTEEEKIALPLGEGDADFTSIIQNLKKKSYQGFISFEYFDLTPQKLIQKSIEWIERME